MREDITLIKGIFKKQDAKISTILGEEGTASPLALTLSPLPQKSMTLKRASPQRENFVNNEKFKEIVMLIEGHSQAIVL